MTADASRWALVDQLLDEAAREERAERPEAAAVALTIATAELLARGKTFRYLNEWLARLESAVGRHGSARIAADAARAHASDGPGLFRTDVLRASIARAALDVVRTESILASLHADGPDLGPPVPERLPQICAWLRSLSFREAPRTNVSLLRVEAALTIAELWADRGKFVSASALVDSIEPDLSRASVEVDLEQVQLLQIELGLAAGDVAAAAARFARLDGAGDRTPGLRMAIVRARIALLGGNLAVALKAVARLDLVPVDDLELFTAAAAVNIAVQTELNLLDVARATAQTAAARLVGRADATHHVLLLERAQADAAHRKRSAIALWELPALPHSDAAGRAELQRATLGDPQPTQRFVASWTAKYNEVLTALEKGDWSAARYSQERLEETTRGAESRLIAARVGLARTLVEFYAVGPSEEILAALRTLAGEFEQLGIPAGQAQCLRFAAWCAARLDKIGEYVATARHASAVVDAIAEGLDAKNRTLFLMNKWTGRDELVSARMREILERGKPRRRELCRVFREIQQLTHWPIDNAFELDDAVEDEAVPDLVMGWVRERLSVPSTATGFVLRSPWSLWRFPARTLALHYHVLPDRTYLFRIARRRIDLVELPTGRLQLPLDMRSVADDPIGLESLARDMGVTDALREFPGIRRLLVIPHDVIAGVPFGALPAKEGRLCEHVATTFVDRLDRFERRRRPRSEHRSFLGVGIASYKGSGHPDLPATEQEAQVAATLSEGTQRLLLGSDATTLKVLKALGTVTRAHIAAHGVFDGLEPAKGGILLRAGADEFATLTLSELRRADLSRLELAVLATCRSAESVRMPGRERICLPTALLDARARSVIASLWPVEDEPSIDIMRALYGELASNNGAEALANMQRRMLREKRDPTQWAGYVHYGSE